MDEEQKYVCSSCGSTSDEAGDCCGQPREQACSCGSGKPASQCCGGN